jgi:hypothetical protein
VFVEKLSHLEMLVDRRSDTALGRFLCKIILVVLICPKVLKEVVYGATVGEIEVF